MFNQSQNSKKLHWSRFDSQNYLFTHYNPELDLFNTDGQAIPYTKDGLIYSYKSISGWVVNIAMIDTHIFKLNEYFVELNTANFKVLNWMLNWIGQKLIILNTLLNWIVYWIDILNF